MQTERKSLLANVSRCVIKIGSALLTANGAGLNQELIRDLARQIAELLELPITTIETRLSRARRMLRDEWLTRMDLAAEQSSALERTTHPRAGEPVRD